MFPQGLKPRSFKELFMKHAFVVTKGRTLQKETCALLQQNQPTARSRVQTLSASLIREVANAAMGREDILPFWFGESDQPTPAFIREAAAASLQKGETFYTENLGRPYLREQVSAYLTDLHQTADRRRSHCDDLVRRFGSYVGQPTHS